MKMYRELVVHANAATMMNQVFGSNGDSMPSEWRRSSSTEGQLNQSITERGPIFCFTCSQESDRRNALVMLAPRDRASYQVANILPFGERLTPREYNRILDDFYRQVLLPAATRLGLKVEISPNEEVELEQWMSPKTAEKFRQFLGTANPFTGHAPSNDSKDWNEFVLSAHEDRDRCKFDSALLRRWLIEESKWPEDIADQMAMKFTSGRELLAYEASRRSA